MCPVWSRPAAAAVLVCLVVALSCAACSEDARTGEETTISCSGAAGTPQRKVADDVLMFEVTPCGQVVYATQASVGVLGAGLEVLWRRDLDVDLDGVWLLGDGRWLGYSYAVDGQDLSELRFLDLQDLAAEPFAMQLEHTGQGFSSLGVRPRVGSLGSALVVVTADSDVAPVRRVDLESGVVETLDEAAVGLGLLAAGDRAVWKSTDGSLRTVEGAQTARLLGPNASNAALRLSGDGRTLILHPHDCPDDCTSTVLRLEDGDVLATSEVDSSSEGVFVGPDRSLPAVLPADDGYTAVGADGSVSVVTGAELAGAGAHHVGLITTDADGLRSFVLAPLGAQPTEGRVLETDVGYASWDEAAEGDGGVVVFQAGGSACEGAWPECDRPLTVALLPTVDAESVEVATTSTPQFPYPIPGSGAVALAADFVTLEPAGGPAEPSGPAVCVFDMNGRLLWRRETPGTMRVDVHPGLEGEVLVTLSNAPISPSPEPELVGEVWALDVSSGVASQVALPPGWYDVRSDQGHAVTAIRVAPSWLSPGALYAGATGRAGAATP